MRKDPDRQSTRRPPRSTPLRVLTALGLVVVIAGAGFHLRGQTRELIRTGELPASEPLMRVAGLDPALDLSNLTVPEDEVLPGGPGKDGIPAILDPVFIPAEEAGYLRPEDLVVGFEHAGLARAYPLRILVWHEVVNDTVNGQPIAVTYCPLCGTAMVFAAEAGGERLTFGVSGLLYQSDVLMYDHKTDGLWSQLKMEAVSGPYVGTRLEWLPSELMTWEAWRAAHPEGEVLSTETGFRRDYDRTPYTGYEQRPGTMFPVPTHREDLPTKEWVAGVIVDGSPMAYPIAALRADEDGRVEDEAGGVPLVVSYEPDAQRVVVTHAKTGERIPHVNVFWFAWQAFYPETGLYAP